MAQTSGMTSEQLDLYFEECYSASNNFTLRANGRVDAALQMQPYRQTFYGRVLHAALIERICIRPEVAGMHLDDRLLLQAHRSLFEHGAVMSFVIPKNEEERRYYQQPEHGAYWDATYRREVVFTTQAEPDTRVSIDQPDEWPDDLYIYFRRRAGFDFMLHPGTAEFYAALGFIDLDGGFVLTARRGQQVEGLCAAAIEADGRTVVRAIVADSDAIIAAFLEKLRALTGNAEIIARIPVPGATKDAVPYAMARVVNVERLLETVASIFSDFQLQIGVDQDILVPENNGFYAVQDSHVIITPVRPKTIVTPGGLAAMFVSAHPMYMQLLLND